MEDSQNHHFEGIGNIIRKKRSQNSRRRRPGTSDQSPLSTQTSDDAGKVSSDDINGVDANPKRKVFSLNQCVSRSISVTRDEAELPHKKARKDNGKSSSNHNGFGDGSDKSSGVAGNGETKSRKVKIKVIGVKHGSHAQSNSHGMSGSESPSQSTRSSDVPKPRLKLTLKRDPSGNNSPKKNTGLQGIPWKDFPGGGFSRGRDDSSMGKRGEKSDQVRKSKRVQKKRRSDGEFDEDFDDDDEIRYLEKLKTSKVAAAHRTSEEESSQKHRSLSAVSKIDHEEQELVSGDEQESGKKKQGRDSPDPPAEGKRPTLTSRQRALLCGRDSASGGSQIEFPDGLPPAPSRKQKEKLTEVEQQIKRTEAAERRRIQNEKAAQESQAEAIRKILGQDSTRKKREDKLKQRREELAQERAANAHIIPPGTVRTVMRSTGTVISFAEDIGLPSIFTPKPNGYPRPREKCAGPSCANPYKYRDSKSKLPLCSLQCYKAINESMQADAAS